MFLLFLGLSHSWTRTDCFFFFPYYFPLSDVSKSLKYHRTGLAANGETVPHEMKQKSQRTNRKF